MTDLLPSDPDEIDGYRVVSRLGAGGQGVVYLATTPSGERVAIKRLKLEDDRTRQQFVKEVAAARRVAPFCTARVVDVQMHGPSPYVVSEYIDGPSLQQQIDQAGPMTGAPLHRLAIGTITALAAIHQVGVVHRDFKPANVMLASDGPRVIDFGIARDLSTETTVTSRIFGTPAYMAPEQLEATGVRPATDIFAWASVIAFSATGKTPFQAPHMMAVVHRITTAEPDLTGVPDDLLPILRHCLAKDPTRRPSGQQVLALLLGRPAPMYDTVDPTPALAEATHLVHAAGPAKTVAAQPFWKTPVEAAPTAVFSATPPRPPVAKGRHSDPRPRYEPDPRVAAGGGRRRTVVVLGLLLPLVVAAIWGLNQIRESDLERQDASIAEPTGSDEPNPEPTTSTSPSPTPTPRRTVAKRTTRPPEPPATRSSTITGISGKCMDVAARTEPNVPNVVQITNCNGNQAQQWTVEPNGTIKAFDRCLDVANASTENGALLQLFDCNGSSAQIFSYDASTQEIINKAANRCLDIDANLGDADGTQLQIWDCIGGDNQKWAFGR